MSNLLGRDCLQMIGSGPSLYYSWARSSGPHHIIELLDFVSGTEAELRQLLVVLRIS